MNSTVEGTGAMRFSVRGCSISTVIFSLLLVVLNAVPVSAKNFVSYNGQFYLTYPDSWEQIDYRSVDFFLTQNNADPALLKYEVVLAPSTDRAFYDEPYVMLTFDSVGELIGRSRDSALAAIASGFANHVDSVKSGEVLSRLKADMPLYVSDQRLLLVQTDMHEGRITTRRNLLAVRFTMHGVANFYFYATDSAWSGVLPTFVQIAESLTEGTQPAGVTKETLKVADLSKDSGSADPDIKRYWPVGSGMVVILIVILAARRKRRKNSAA